MAIEIEVEITGTGAFAGHKSNIGSYSYSEESTPTIDGDSSGGVGQLSFDVREDEDNSIFLYKDNVRLTDSFSGSVAGNIDTVAVTDGVASITGRSRLALLTTVQTVPVIETTLGDLLTEIFTLAGVNTSVDIDAGIAARSIISPAYTGDLWVFLKNICTKEQIEVALVDDTVTVRNLRERTITPLNINTEGYNVADLQLAQFVEVAYYNYESFTNGLTYPKGGWTSDVQVYQVDSGQTLVVDLPVDAYLTSIQQPTPQLFVSRTYAGPNSVYTIAGNDGLPVPVAQWTDNGGNVSLALKENGTVIEATIVGATIPNLAPFRLAVSSGPSDFYSTLRIIGTGVFFDRQVLTKPTGLTGAETSTIVGLTIDNPMISTELEALEAGVRACQMYGLPGHTYTFTARRVNRSGDEGPDIIYPSFEVTEADWPGGWLFSDFNAEYSGDSFQDFADMLLATVVNDFDNQAFGNIAGSRIKFRDAWFRVRSSDSTQDSVSITAERDTLFSDVNPVWASGDFADFNGVYDGLNFTDFALAPLRSAA